MTRVEAARATKHNKLGDRISLPPVLECGTTFHLDYGGRDLPSTPSDNLWNLIYLATEVLSDSTELIGTIK